MSCSATCGAALQRAGSLAPATPVGRRSAALAALREAAFVLAMFQLYRFARLLTADEEAVARANAADVVALQAAVLLPDERVVQRWALQLDGLAQAANAYYLGLHFPVVLGLLVWLFVRHRWHYCWLRDVLFALTFSSLVIHLAMPLAPPRMLPGFVDTGVAHGMSAYGGAVGGTANQIAAMPSLHVAWSGAVALAVVVVLRSRWRWLALLHPVLTTGVVVVTANHYWLDAGVALVLLAAAALLLGPRSLSARHRGAPPVTHAADCPVAAPGSQPARATSRSASAVQARSHMPRCSDSSMPCQRDAGSPTPVTSTVAPG